MTNGELKELLDEYGDHLPVVVVVDRGADDVQFDSFDLDTQTRNGEPALAITVELS